MCNKPCRGLLCSLKKSLQNTELGGKKKHRIRAFSEGIYIIRGAEITMGKELANHSSIVAWQILWTEEPGRLQSKGSQSRT